MPLGKTIDLCVKLGWSYDRPLSYTITWKLRVQLHGATVAFLLSKFADRSFPGRTFAGCNILQSGHATYNLTLLKNVYISKAWFANAICRLSQNWKASVALPSIAVKADVVARNDRH